ncbi:MAG: hypothetical protein HY390_05725 [Deltaproteobacteria bacterium]|nr:hypothetical protein [Deltaproteobacteria bacterium]
MFKKMFLVLTILALPVVLFAGEQRSLKFGEEGFNSVAKVQVYVDKDEPTPRCKCVRFSVLVDDRQPGIVGATFINKVAVVVEGLEPSANEESSRILTPWSIWRSPDSPGRTSQVVVQVPEDVSFENVRFRVLALKNRALHPDYDELVIDTQGKFSGADVNSLKASTVQELLRNK